MFKRKHYAIYLEDSKGVVSCVVTCNKGAVDAWQWAYQKIKENKDEGVVRIVDVKRVE